MDFDATLVASFAALLTAIGGIFVPLYTAKRSRTNAQLDEITAQLEKLSDNDKKQSQAIRSITLAHLRQIYDDGMKMTAYSQSLWSDFNICYDAYRDLEGNGEGEAMKAAMDAKRSVLLGK